MRKIKILLLDQSIVEFTKEDMTAFLRTKAVIVMCICATLFLLLANPDILSSTASSFSRAFYWAVSISIYLAIMPHYVDWVFHYWTKMSDQPLLHIGPTIPLIIALTYSMEGLAVISGGLLPERSGPITPTILVVNVFVGFALEGIGLYWLFPSHLASKPENETDIRFIHFNGEQVPLSSIHIVKSEYKYLIVTTGLGSTRHLCRMKDFLIQVADNDGLSPHRSYWIAKNNIIRLSGQRIKTRSGHDVPVARGKIEFSKNWLKQHGIRH